jgi:NAD(P)-dependent dehydrogenase (short-subunit alcohol dehydrogenase family)
MHSRVALVTGSSSGIGAASVETLAQTGWTVYATARRVASLSAFAAQGIATLALDVTDENRCSPLCGGVRGGRRPPQRLVWRASPSTPPLGAVQQIAVRRNLVLVLPPAHCVTGGLGRASPP